MQIICMAFLKSGNIANNIFYDFPSNTILNATVFLLSIAGNFQLKIFLHFGKADAHLKGLRYFSFWHLAVLCNTLELKYLKMTL